MPETLPAPLPDTVTPAVVVSAPPDALEARPLRPARAAHLPVRVAVRDYQPSAGDRVLLASDGSEAYIVGVLHARQPQALAAGGVRALACEGALEVRDAGERLLARFADGHVEICAAQGDLELAAPAGAVRIRSALDVTLEAGRDVATRARREVALEVGDGAALRLDRERAELAAPRLAVQAREVNLRSARVEAIVGRLATTAERVAYNAERFEVTAERVTERAAEVLREVKGLLETHVGRARTVVKETWALRSGRTVMRSEKDTAIDGRKILLG